LRERLEVAARWISRGFPVRRVLRIVGVAHSTYYAWRNRCPRPHPRRGGRPMPGYSRTYCGKKVSDEGIKDLLRSAIGGDGYPYGYRKLTHWLRREHRLVINPKKVYRLCREMGILHPHRRRRQRFPRRVAATREVRGVNQVWATDVKYGYIEGERRFFFVQTILDVADRSVIDYHIGLTCTGAQAAVALQGALERRAAELGDRRPVVRCDNGPQFTSQAFRETCHKLGVEIEYIPVQTPNKNAHIEAFHSLLERECLRRHEFSSFAEAYMTVIAYMEYYNNRRIHSSLGYRTPKEYHEAILRKTVTPTPIKL